MNDRSDPRSRLIADLFNGDWSEGPAADHALRAAALARRRRMMRQSLWAATGALGAAAAIAVASHLPRPLPVPQAIPPRQSIAAAPAYEIMTDDELIAEVHDRPLLILGTKATSRRIVLLDRGT